MNSNRTIRVKGIEITVISHKIADYISLTDMMKAKDGDFFYLGLVTKQEYD